MRDKKTGRFTNGSRPEFLMEGNPAWKGGTPQRPDGYLLIRIKKKYRLAHRHIMEEHLGRKLMRKEQVHHINGNRADNRIENLMLLGIKEHSKLHAISKRKRVIIQCFICGMDKGTLKTACYIKTQKSNNSMFYLRYGYRESSITSKR